MACVETAVTDHFIVLFRDVPDKTLDELHNGDGFLHILIIFMTVVMKGYGVAVIFVDPGGSDDRTSQITANVFDDGPGVTFIGFGVNIEPFFMLPVTEGFHLFKGETDSGFHFVKEGGAEGITKKTIVEMVDMSPQSVVAATAFRDKTVDVRVPLQVSAKGMKNHDKARSEVHGFILLKKHAGDHAADGMKETVEQGTVMKKEKTKILINGKDTVAMLGIYKLKGHGGSALHGIKVTTGGAEAAVAAERYKFKLATVRAAIHGAAKGWISAVDHFIYVFNNGITWM